MLEINGNFYYIDFTTLKEFSKDLLDTEDSLRVIESEVKETINGDGNKESEIVKRYQLNVLESKNKINQIIDECLRNVLVTNEIDLLSDDDVKSSEEQTAFKISFNTLLMNKIIKVYKGEYVR